MDNTLAGNKGETLACEYLKEQGYKIIERNYRIRGGEIDIVARDGDYLVFIEVKARYSHEYGSPLESITPWKIKTLLKTALFYVVMTKWGERPYRIDVVSIDYTSPNPPAGGPEIELVKNITG